MYIVSLWGLNGAVLSISILEKAAEIFNFYRVSHIEIYLLKEKKICKLNFVWRYLYSWGYGIWVSSTSFQKSNIGWPQKPSTEMFPYISESLDFWLIIPQKMNDTVHFDAIDY